MNVEKLLDYLCEKEKEYSERIDECLGDEYSCCELADAAAKFQLVGDLIIAIKSGEFN